MRRLVACLLLLAPMGVSSPLRAQDRSGVRPEVLSVPSGPGSIEGLGEAFSQSPSTGTSSFSVGIDVPEGVGEFSPTLELSYSSGAGNSECGLGWTLGLPSIQLSTLEHLPRYDGSDRFVLMGLGNASAQDLVRMSDGFYRFRVESSFVRVEHKSDGSFEVRTRDGNRYRFATSAHATIADGPRVFAWLLTEQLDTHGNTIRVEWERDATGRPYVDRIVYNDFSSQTRNLVEFEWESRPDAIASFLSTFRVTTAQRLSGIRVSHGGQLVRRYEITYDAEDGLSRLSRIEMVGDDDTTHAPPLTFAYAASTASSMNVVSMTNGPSRALGTTAELDDVDGDALPDLLLMDPAVDGGTYSYYPNLDGSSFGPRQTMTATPSIWLSSSEAQLADMDGDGISDVLARVSNASDGLRYYPGGSSSTFGAAVTITPNLSQGLDDPSLRMVDLDHDRRTDWMRIDPTTGVVYVAFNEGNGVMSASAARPSIDPNEVVSFAAGARLADCNGDGLTDIALVRSQSVRCWHSRGRGYFEPATTIGAPPTLSNAELPYIEFRDLSGDGLADLAYVGVSEVRLWVNLGGVLLSAPRVISGTPSRTLNTVVRIVDINANGSDDIVWVDPTNIGAPWRYLDVLSSGAPGLLSRIDNGLGRVISIEYASIGAMRGWARSNGQPWAERSPVSQMVVSSVTTEDGIDAAEVVRTNYTSPYFDAERREFVGFGHVERVDVGDAEQPSLVTVSNYDVSAVHEVARGQLQDAVRQLEDGRQFDRLARQVTVSVLDTSIDGEVVEYISAASETREVLELEASGPTIETRTEMDSFGNITLEASYGLVSGADRAAGADERLIRRTYAINTDSWILDNIATERVESLGGTRISEKRFYYDGPPRVGLPLRQVSRGDRMRSESWVSGDTLETDEQFEVDDFGNVVVEVDARGSTRTVVFDDASHTFEISETQTVNDHRALTWTAVYDERHDVITELTDPSGEKSVCDYDALGRVVQLRQPGDPTDRPSETYRYVFSSPVSYVRTESPVGDGGIAAVSIAFIDGRGRSRGTARSAGAGRWAYDGATRYGARGLRQHLANPTFRPSADPVLDASTLVGVDIAHDAVGRELGILAPDGSRTRVEYLALGLRRFDENDNDASSPQYNTPQTRASDGLGRVVRVDEYDEGAVRSTSFERDPLGHLTALDGAAGRRTFAYDGRSRRTAMTDATTGTTLFRYSSGGDLVEEQDAVGNVVRFEYDLVGRKLAEWHRPAGATEDTRFALLHYDEPAPGRAELGHVLGRLAWVDDAAGTVYFGYDVNGRPTDAIRRFPDGHEYHTWTEFDQGGRPTRRGYPDRSYLGIEYDERGLARTLGPIVGSIEWSAFDEVSSIELGNGAERTIERDVRNRVQVIREVLPGGSEPIHLEYTRDAGSRLRRIIDRRSGITPESDGSSTFSYDDMDRVRSEVTSRETSAWTYDPSGNLAQSTRTSGGSTFTQAYVYQALNARPFAPSSVGGRPYTYDAAGRVTSDGVRTFEWDAQGRVSGITGPTVSEVYVYDYLGRRVEKRESGGERPSVVRYIDNDVEVRDGQLHRYVMLGSERLADMSSSRVEESALGAGVSSPGVWAVASLLALILVGLMHAGRTLRAVPWTRSALGFAVVLLMSACQDEPRDLHGGHAISEIPAGTRFLHSDAQGAVRAETDVAGVVVAEATYDAFGSVTFHQGAASSHGTFQRNEVDGVGIADFRTRPYDSSTGLFLAPDPVPQAVPESAADSPLDSNLYLYAAGRTPNFQDPTGLCVGPIGLLCIAAAALAEGGITITVGDLALAAGAATVATYGAHARQVNRWAQARGQRIAQSLARRGRVRFVFATYTMILSDNSTYSGRTSTIARAGESDEVAGARSVRERGIGHHRDAGRAAGLRGQAVLDRVSSATVNFGNRATLRRDLLDLGTAFLQIRGREQALINHYGGARSMANAAGQRGSSGNSINGIGLTNPILVPALAAAAIKWPDVKNVPSFVPTRGWR